ncbi:MAG: hypothetical protein KC912_23600 [Proteobacteria bacterium]|nr:hypothetical protein [Pseudomonadota bacterium]
MKRLVLVVAALLIGTACDDTVFPGGGPSYPPGQVGVKALLEDQCALCHPAIEPAYTFPDDVWTDVADGTEALVVPGDPEASLLWRVMTNPGPDEAVMPSGGLLPIETVQHVEAWILDGAPIDEVQ